MLLFGHRIEVRIVQTFEIGISQSKFIEITVQRYYWNNKQFVMLIIAKIKICDILEITMCHLNEPILKIIVVISHSIRTDDSIKIIN